MSTLPPPGKKCWAALIGNPNRQCAQDASETGQRYFCKQHRDKLVADPSWPLAPPYKAYRAALVELVRSAGGLVASPEQTSGKDVAGWLGKLVEMKAIAAALILIAAFFSEYLFLAPFDIDFAYFLATVDAAPLFVRNLSGILLFSVVVFLALSLLVTVLVSAGSLGSGISNYNEKKNRENREHFRQLHRTLAGLRADEAAATGELRTLDQERLAIAARLHDLCNHPGEAYDRTRALLARWTQPLVRKIAMLLGARTKGTNNHQRDAEQRRQAARWVQAQRVKASLRLDAIDARTRELRQRIVETRTRIAWSEKRFAAAKKKVQGFRRAFVRPSCVHFSTAIHTQFLTGPIPRFLRVRHSQVLFLACVLVIPLTAAYYDGKTMLWCTRALVESAAEKTRLVCPSNGRPDWSFAMPAAQPPPGGARRGDLHTMGFSSERGAAPAESRTAIESLIARLFATLRKPLRFLARNYPVVTVTFKDSPDVSVSGRDEDAPTRVCAAAKSVAGTMPVSGPQRRACPLVRNNTSVRMVLLGEAGVWTLLHSLGEKGAPLFVKTSDIAAISHLPLVVENAPRPVPPPVQVTVDLSDAAKLALGPIEQRLEAMHATIRMHKPASPVDFEGIASSLRQLHNSVTKLASAARPESIEIGFTADGVAALRRLASIWHEGFSQPGKPAIPAKYIGVEQHLPAQCLQAPVIADIEFERGATRKPARHPDVLEAVDKLLFALKSSYFSRDQQVNVVVEGTADSTGTPDVNVGVSDRRATFMHHVLERAIAQSRDPAIVALQPKMTVLSYGSGEALRTPAGAGERGGRAVLVRICNESQLPAAQAFANQ